MDNVDKRKILTSSAYFLSFLVLGLTEAAIGPSLPSLAKLAGTSLGGISILFIAQKAGYLFGSLIGGRLYDRMKAHALLGIVILFMGAGMFFIPLSPGLVVLLFIIFIVGFSEGTLDVGGNVLLVWVNPPRVNSMMNALHLFFGIGAFISPLILAASLRFYGGITWGFRILGVSAVPVAVFVFALPSPAGKSQAAEGDGRQEKAGIIALITLLFFLILGTEAAYGSWIYSYALAENYADYVTAGLMTSAYWGALTLGRLAAIFISLRVGPKMLILSALVLTAASLALLSFLPGSAGIVWTFTVLIGFALGPLFASLITLSSQNLHMTGSVTGVFLVGTSIGGMVLPWGIGQFFESRGPGVMPVSLLINTAAALCVFFIILTRIKRVNLNSGKPGA